MLLSPTGAALSTKPLYQALSGRQENVHIEGGVICPTSQVHDVGGSGSRSGMGADTSAIRHREHTARRVCRLKTLGRLLLRHFGRLVSRLLLVGGCSSNCVTVCCNRIHSSGTKERNSIPMRPAPSPAPFLKHLRAKRLQVVVDLPPEAGEACYGSPPDLNPIPGSYRPSIRKPRP
jgi:hypothetical protein